ncbi:MAG TPA: hypothetical protein VJG30_00260 [Candidatus Nanoarchaeia archaeon]|nr:hypothetical protein [Candidatus Nanoarchaeia archaeon]
MEQNSRARIRILEKLARDVVTSSMMPTREIYDTSLDVLVRTYAATTPKYNRRFLKWSSLGPKVLDYVRNYLVENKYVEVQETPKGKKYKKIEPKPTEDQKAVA